MTSYQPSKTNERLRLGIEAARTGKEKEAREHLIAVLKQEPNNIPAMLWLAFVLPSPQDTIRLLQRVLALDPENERAKAGIRWAKGRLGLPAEPPETSEAETQPSSTQAVLTSIDPSVNRSDPASADEFIRTQLLPNEDVQKKAKKGALAHRARRKINPFLGIIIITGLVGMAAILLGALTFVPVETWAALLSTLSRNVSREVEVTASTPIAAPTEPIALLESDPPSFTSAVDTIPIVASAQDAVPSITEPAFAISLTGVEPSLGAAAPDPLAEVSLPGVEPSTLIGPKLLAHQPAYPGEKWIEVNVTTQQVTAWEGNVPVMSFTTSTGLPDTPTVLGKFNIYWKLESALMIGSNYYLPEVPYTMYFYGGYALHGTYWHNNFGQPMSHGCVNLETGNAQKLFEWADPVMPPGQTQVVATGDNPGTLVVVHQ